ELMLIAGGVTFAAAIWGDTEDLRQAPGGVVIVCILMALAVIASFVLALFTVAGRPMEEWIFILLYYFGMPKLFLYMPQEEENEQQGEKKKRQNVKKPQNVAIDPYDEDISES